MLERFDTLKVRHSQRYFLYGETFRKSICTNRYSRDVYKSNTIGEQGLHCTPSNTMGKEGLLCIPVILWG